jgi:hypothetical protein
MDTRFRLDREYDRDYASDGHSRYGAYLNQSQATFEEIIQDDPDDPTVPFTSAVWRIARGPIMVPPFVASPPRVLSAQLERSEWNGQAILNVDLIGERPEALRGARPEDGGWYRSWPQRFGGEYESVGAHDLESGAYLLTTVQVLRRVPAGFLPRVDTVPTRGRALLDQAVEAVEAVVRLMNREIGPLLDQLDGKAAGGTL